MIAVIKTDSGNYNIFGTRDQMFILEGNLTKDELKDFVKQANAALKLKS